MYNVYFYKDRSGRMPALEYIQKVAAKRGKDARINLGKIRDYIKILMKYGTDAGEPYMKHLGGGLWEIRPLHHRVFFAAWEEDGFVLLHAFQKRTQKTPIREIRRARRELKDLLERGMEQ